MYTVVIEDTTTAVDTITEARHMIRGATTNRRTLGVPVYWAIYLGHDDVGNVFKLVDEAIAPL